MSLASRLGVAKGFGFAIVFVMVQLVAVSDLARATTTVCSEKASKRNHYGQHASVQFRMPQDGLDSITEAVQAYAARNRLSYSSVGSEDPYKTPAFKSLTHILQSETVDVAIHIRATNRSNIATATISTFSSKCGATEDWHPYWEIFRSFIEANKFAVVESR